jgi:hypothetical protein
VHDLKPFEFVITGVIYADQKRYAENYLKLAIKKAYVGRKLTLDRNTRINDKSPVMKKVFKDEKFRVRVHQPVKSFDELPADHEKPKFKSIGETLSTSAGATKEALDKFRKAKMK